MLILLVFSLQATCFVQGAEIRCNPNHIGYNSASKKCLIHHICTPRGVCGLLGQGSIVITRGRHFRPTPNDLSRSLELTVGRCGERFGGGRCDTSGKFGPCCSRRGWCGSSPAHCHQAMAASTQALPIQLLLSNLETHREMITYTILTRFIKPLSCPEHETPGGFRIAITRPRNGGIRYCRQGRMCCSWLWMGCWGWGSLFWCVELGKEISQLLLKQECGWSTCALADADGLNSLTSLIGPNKNFPNCQSLLNS